MRHRVEKNGETIIITDKIQHAYEAYNKCIYFGKEGDIIRFTTRKSPNHPWKLVRRDIL